jgi:hypothetical protein
MRTVRIASTVKHIEEADSNVTLFQIRSILSEHRTTLIMRILADLPTYVQFKFNIKLEKDKQGLIRDRLFEVSNSIINLDRYDTIVQEILKNQNFHVPSQQFFNEIDSVIENELYPSQLMLVR